MKHVLSVLVENRPGVLSRVTGLISRRGFNIESLSVGPTEDPTLSRVTAIVLADDVAYEQITKQLHKLISVHKITDLTDEGAIERELVLFKVNAASERRSEIIEIANIFRAKIVDVGKSSLTIEATGDDAKLRGLEDLLRAYGIKETVRTGKVALSRSSRDWEIEKATRERNQNSWPSPSTTNRTAIPTSSKIRRSPSSATAPRATLMR